MPHALVNGEAADGRQVPRFTGTPSTLSSRKIARTLDMPLRCARMFCRALRPFSASSGSIGRRLSGEAMR